MKTAQQHGPGPASRWAGQWLASLLLAALLAPVVSLAAQGNLGLSGIQKGFKAAEFFGPPNETRMQSLLQAEKVQPFSEKLFLLSGLTLQTYRENGEPELLIKAPQCLYDRDAKSASSPGPLRVTTADGKFSIEGEGFSLLQTSSSLNISNRVRTIIDADLLNPQTNSRAKSGNKSGGSGVEIRADQFEYSGDTGVGVYERQVHVTGTNDMSLASEKLAFELPFKERQLKTLKAERDVVVDHAGVRATGQTALYSAATGLIRLRGNPAWRHELREGRGDELIIDRTNKIFRAEGHAWVRMPAQGLSISSLLSASNNIPSASAKATNQFVEVASEFHEFLTNQATFGERVLVTEYVGNQARGTLSCGHMVASYTGTNQLQTLVAQRQVLLQDGTNTLSSGQAVFNGTNGVLLLTENPAWSSGQRSGKGDLIRVNTRANELLVQGHATMRLPATELARAADPRTGVGEKKLAPPGTNEWAEVSSQEYTLRPGGAQFRGGVRATHPRMTWSCDDTLLVELPQAGGQIENLVANKRVTFELADEKGQKIHGRGDQAVYSYKVTSAGTNDLLQLTGDPAVLETAQGTNRNKIIVLDRAKQQIITPGDYKIATALKGVGTNALELPNTKLRK